MNSSGAMAGVENVLNRRYDVPVAASHVIVGQAGVRLRRLWSVWGRGSSMFSSVVTLGVERRPTIDDEAVSDSAKPEQRRRSRFDLC